MHTHNWTTTNIPDLSGKTIIVTGGNSGLGFETVKALAGRNGHIIMTCRSLQKGEEALNKIIETFPAGTVELMVLDLTDLNSIQQFAIEFKAKHNRLDILINNAGVMMIPYEKTKDGFEKQIGTNHLGHFALTGLLLEVLKNTPKSRVVTVTSMAHKSGVMDFDNFMFEKSKSYNAIKAYGRSKLANLLFSYELQRYFDKQKIDCISLAAHPGVSDTNLAQHLTNKWLYKLVITLIGFAIQPANMGSLPQLRAATDKKAKGGDFYGPAGKWEMKGYPEKVKPSKKAKNREDAKKLWELSQKLTSVYFK